MQPTTENAYASKYVNEYQTTMSIECLDIKIQNIPIDIVTTLCYPTHHFINIIVNISPLGNQRLVTIESHILISNNTNFDLYFIVQKQG